MKRAAITLLAFAAFSCASSDNNAKNNRMKLELEQIVGASPVQSTGRFDVRYALNVENPTQETVTLKAVEVSQIGTGSYVIRRDPGAGNTNGRYTFDQKVAPGQSGQVTFWVHAFQLTRPGDFGASEPVTLRAGVFFDAPSGSFRQVIQKVLSQFESQ